MSLSRTTGRIATLSLLSVLLAMIAYDGRLSPSQTLTGKIFYNCYSCDQQKGECKLELVHETEEIGSPCAALGLGTSCAQACKCPSGTWPCETNQCFAAFSKYENWISYQPNIAEGFVGAVYDRDRYMYFVPYKNDNGPHGVVWRYDTRAALNSQPSWGVFDPSSNGLGAAARGFSGGAFDGRYVYFAPNENASGPSGAVMRYDTTKNMAAVTSWELFDPSASGLGAAAKGFNGAVFDGNYIYFVPDSNATGGHNDVLRYDVKKPFDAASSWELFNPKSPASTKNGYAGAIYDGRYVYFIPKGGDATKMAAADAVPVTASLLAQTTPSANTFTATGPNGEKPNANGIIRLKKGDDITLEWNFDIGCIAGEGNNDWYYGEGQTKYTSANPTQGKSGKVVLHNRQQNESFTLECYQQFHSISSGIPLISKTIILVFDDLDFAPPAPNTFEIIGSNGTRMNAAGQLTVPSGTDVIVQWNYPEAECVVREPSPAALLSRDELTAGEMWDGYVYAGFSNQESVGVRVLRARTKSESYHIQCYKYDAQSASNKLIADETRTLNVTAAVASAGTTGGQNGPSVSAPHGDVLRYDTRAPFKTATSWTTFDPSSNGVGSNARGYNGAAFDGTYIYFAPYINSSGPHSEVLRYNTKQTFATASSWTTFNVATSGIDANAKGYIGAAFDGQFVYFGPYYNGKAYHGKALRYDTKGAYSDKLSWTVYEIGTAKATSSAGGTVGGRYRVFTASANINWMDAEASCVSKGGHLASITSAADAADALKAIDFKTNVWIGLNDRATEGDYKWTTGVPFSYTDWDGGQPNGTGIDDGVSANDCVFMNHATTGKWHDVGCDDPGYQTPNYLCEFAAASSKSSAATSSVPTGGGGAGTFGATGPNGETPVDNVLTVPSGSKVAFSWNCPGSPAVDPYSGYMATAITCQLKNGGTTVVSNALQGGSTFVNVTAPGTYTFKCSWLKYNSISSYEQVVCDKSTSIAISN